MLPDVHCAAALALQRTVNIAPPVGHPVRAESACQFDGYLTRIGTIAHLQPCPNLAMPPYPPARRYLVIQHFVIQIMDEAIARRHRPVRPFIDAT